MRIITLFVALAMVTGAVAQERCGCNKPRPKQAPAAPVKQQPIKPAAQPK